jgi:hypothetical protein
MNEYWLAVPTAALIVLLFATMNEIANDIEEPFKFYPALIPLQLRQMQFNERLIAICDTRRPLGFADVLKDIYNPRGYDECNRAVFKVRVMFSMPFNVFMTHMHRTINRWKDSLFVRN